MYRLTKGTIVAAAVAAAVVGLGTTEASAAGTYTVTGGGSFTGTSTDTLLTDTSTGTVLTCSTATASGSAANGTGLSGTALASVSGATFTGCTGPAGISFTVSASNLPWKFNATGYSGGVTTGTLTGVEASISGACNATFGGTTSGGPATLTGSYDNADHTLSITGGTLIAENVSGLCLGLINNGDSNTFTGDYALSPATLQVTSP